MTESSNISSASPKRGRLRKWWRRLAWVLVFLSALIVAAAVTLQTNWAAEKVRGLAERKVSAALHDGRLEIGHLEGNLLYRLTASDIRVMSGDSLVLSVDTLRAKYSLLSLVTTGIRLFELDVVRPAVVARQRSDSTWDLFALVPEDTSQGSGAGSTVRLDHVRIDDGRGEVRFLASQPDSSIFVSDLSVSARDIYLGDGAFGSTLDDMRAKIVAPVAPNPVALIFSGELAEDRVICAACRLESVRSSVALTGHLLFPNGEGLRGDLALRLDSLSMGDIAFALPSADPDESVVGEAHLVGTSDSLEAGLSLQTSGGTTAELRGFVRTGEGARVRLEGTIENFDPATVLPTQEFAGAVNATVDVDLRGRRLATVDGPFALRIHDTVLNGVHLRDGHLTGRFNEGNGTLNASFYLPGLSAEVSGSVNPFADTLAYHLIGSLRGARLSRYYAAASAIDSVDAGFEIQGRGSTLSDMVARGSVNLTRLNSSLVRLGPSHISASLNRGDLRVDGGIKVRSLDNQNAGSLGFDAQMAVENEKWHVRRLRLQASDVNPQLIEITAPAGLLSGHGAIEGDFTADSLLRASGSFTVNGTLGKVSVSRADVLVSLEAGSGSYDLDLLTSIGKIEAAGNFSRRVGGYDISARGDVSELDLDTLAAAKLVTSINGAFQARSRLRNGEFTSLALNARLARSVVNDQVLSNALIEAALADSNLTFDVDVDLPNGGLSGEGSMQLYADETRIDLHDGSFSHIDVGAWLGRDTLVTDLNGSMIGSVRGAEFDGKFELASSRINRAKVRNGLLQFTASDSTFRLETTVEVEEGRARATVSGGFGRADTTYQGMFQLHNVGVAELAGMDSLTSKVNAGCSFVGSNFVVPRLKLSAFCTGNKSRIGKVQLDSLRFETRLDQDSLALKSLFLRSNVADIAGSGAIPTRREDARSDSQIKVTLVLKDMGPAAPLVRARALSGEGSLILSLGGSVESPTFGAEATLAYLKYDDYRVSSIDGFASAPDLSEGHIIAAVDMGFSVYNEVPVQHTSIEFERADGKVLLTGDVRIDGGRKGSISARYESGDSLGVVVIDGLNLNLEGEVWTLSEEASFEIGDQWSVRTFLMFSGDQQIALDGYIDPNGDQNLIVTLEQVRLGAFSDLVGYPGVEGTGEGYVVLTGAYNDLKLESNVRIQTLKTYGRDVGQFDLSATYLDAQMAVQGTLSHTSGSALTVNGFVPVRLTMAGLDDLRGTEPVQLEVRSDSVPLAWIRPFIDQSTVDRVGGYLVCDVKIGGTWDEPDLSGEARVSKGRLRLPEFKLDMQSIAGSFRLEGEDLLVDDFFADSKGGTLKAKGSVGFRSLDDPTFNLDARLDKFRAISTETYRMTVSGTTKLTGSMIKPVFSGSVSVEDSDIYMTEELMADEVDPVKLTERDLRVLERRFGYQVAAEDTTTWDFYEALDLSLDARIGRDVWLRSYSNPKMDIEFSGDLTIRKPPLEEETLNGTINVNPSRSRVISFARKFEITNGTIQFNGLVDEALVDVKAQYVVPSRFGGDEVKINLAITGQVGEFTLELSSDPQMDTGAMVSYLTTGRPPGEGSVGGSQAAELAVSSLSNLVEGFANSELGLDVVDIQVNPTAGTYLTVGKYVSPRVYVSFTQPLVTNDSYRVGDAAHQTEMAIEYELVSWLVAQIGSSRNHLQVNMIWEFAF